MENKKYIKSPLNYTRGKYKILDKIIPKFPSEINTFVDLFSGGFNVGINVEANRIICNDNINYLIELYEYIKETETEELILKIKQITNKYELNKTNKEGYLKLRNEYNLSKKLYCLYLGSFCSHNFFCFGQDRKSLNRLKKSLIKSEALQCFAKIN